MTVYDFQYSLGQPSERLNGGRHISHDLQAEASIAGTDEWFMVRHKTVLLPADGVMTALSAGTVSEKASAYKQLIADNLFTMDEAVTGWGVAQLQQFLDNNEASIAAAAEITAFVEEELPPALRQFPVKFTM